MSFEFVEPAFLPELQRRAKTSGTRLRKGRYSRSQGGKLDIQTELTWVAAVEDEIYRMLKLGRVPLTIGRDAVWRLVNRLDDELAELTLEHVESPNVGWVDGRQWKR